MFITLSLSPAQSTPPHPAQNPADKTCNNKSADKRCRPFPSLRGRC